MAYTAIKKMQEDNSQLFKENVGPYQPKKHYQNSDCGLKAMALRFLHDRCEGLAFKDDEKHIPYSGTSLKKEQIPFNMQMDINRLCLERELEKFIDSGVAEDAYTVYYCYLEIFFGHYGKSKKMVELLAEFEFNGSSLLMKHRDHYSHSVYVFALGLAIYESNEAFRKAFKKYYGFDADDQNKTQDHVAACCFLEYWGLTALFHDVGYPFELPFEQILSYYEVTGKKRDDTSLYIAYHGLDKVIKLSKAAKNHFKKLYNEEFEDIEELLAFVISDKLSGTYNFSKEYILDVIHDKPLNPNHFGYYMDHAYFSAIRLYQEIEISLGIDAINKKHIDALSAVLLHNSLFKFAILFYKHKDKEKKSLKMEIHPLAYLLMLADELQCWDRVAYGRNSRSQLHPMSADFNFNNGIDVTYYYDIKEKEKIEKYKTDYQKWTNNKEGEAPRLKAYSDMVEKKQSFLAGIGKVVDITDIPLLVKVSLKEVDYKNKHTYLSTSDFLHLYDFAVALNARHAYHGKEEDIGVSVLEKEYEELSLEYQLSNINQAKSFAKYLDAIGCFYTDQPVDYKMIASFSEQQTEKFAPMEHERWIREHNDMGWTNGDFYEVVNLNEEYIKCYGDEESARDALREQLRMHKLAMDGDPTQEEIFNHYNQLDAKEKEKDFEPFNSMLKLIKLYDGLRIYELD